MRHPEGAGRILQILTAASTVTNRDHYLDEFVHIQGRIPRELLTAGNIEYKTLTA